jgi:hypothetical protein
MEGVGANVKQRIILEAAGNKSSKENKKCEDIYEGTREEEKLLSRLPS